MSNLPIKRILMIEKNHGNLVVNPRFCSIVSFQLIEKSILREIKLRPKVHALSITHLALANFLETHDTIPMLL